MVDQVKITVIATGFDETKRRLKELSSKTEVQTVTDQMMATPDELEKEEIPPVEDEWDIPAFLRQGKH